MLVVGRVRKRNGPSPVPSVNTGMVSESRTCIRVHRSEAPVLTSWVRRCILNRDPAALTGLQLHG